MVHLQPLVLSKCQPGFPFGVMSVCDPTRFSERFSPIALTHMRVVVATDEPGPVPDALRSRLDELGHDLITVIDDGSPWPNVGRDSALEVAEGRADAAVVCCWTGTGVSIAANKVPDIRAALCTDSYSAAGARKWNDANVLAIGMRLTTPAVAVEMLDAFLKTKKDPGEAENIARVD